MNARGEMKARTESIVQYKYCYTTTFKEEPKIRLNHAEYHIWNDSKFPIENIVRTYSEIVIKLQKNYKELESNTS